MTGGARIHLLVQPRAAKTELAGLHDGRVRLRLAAPPVDGAANDALVRFLADRLHVRRGDISLVSGSTGRRKTVVVLNLAPDRARELLLGTDR